MPLLTFQCCFCGLRIGDSHSEPVTLTIEVREGGVQALYCQIRRAARRIGVCMAISVWIITVTLLLQGILSSDTKATIVGVSVVGLVLIGMAYFFAVSIRRARAQDRVGR